MPAVAAHRAVDGRAGLGRDGVHQNRERLLAGDVAVSFLRATMADPAVKRLLSTEHFSVDGTLIDAWLR